MESGILPLVLVVWGKVGFQPCPKGPDPLVLQPMPFYSWELWGRDVIQYEYQNLEVGSATRRQG